MGMSKELRDLILEVAAKNPSVSGSADLARFIAKLTPAENVLEFYEACLVREVAVVLAMERNRNLRNAFREEETPPPAKDSPFLSNKLIRRRSWHANLKESRVETENGLKRVGSCTVSDLQFVISVRTKHIDSVQQVIDRYQKIIDMMEEYGAATVDDIPENAW